jgi:hypothetical protein
MNETNVGQVLVDCLEVSFPHYYQQKAFLADASRLRDLARLQTRQALTEDEQREVIELRKRLRRADADTVLLSVIKIRHAGGFLFF